MSNLITEVMLEKAVENRATACKLYNCLYEFLGNYNMATLLAQDSMRKAVEVENRLRKDLGV